MAILNSCCCWKSVRSGSYACAIYTLIFYTTVLTAGAFHVRTVLHSAALLTFSLLMVVLSVACVVTSIVLIIGLCTNNRHLFLPWLVSISLTTLLDVILSFYLIMEAVFDPFIAVLFVTDIFICALNVYCLLCVLSQYQMIQSGHGLIELSIDQRQQMLRCAPSSYNTSTRTPSTMTSTLTDEGVQSTVYLVPPNHRRPSFVPVKPLLYPELSTISEEQQYNPDPIRRKGSADINSMRDRRPISPNQMEYYPYRRLSLNFPYRPSAYSGSKLVQVQLYSPGETSVDISTVEQQNGSPTSV